jgi:uroporphyrinogen decarboxylase
MDIQELADKYGLQLVFWGGIDTQEVLPLWSPDKVRQEVGRVHGILGPNGKYIIGPSQEIMSDVPLENVEALIAGIKDCKGI